MTGFDPDDCSMSGNKCSQVPSDRRNNDLARAVKQFVSLIDLTPKSPAHKKRILHFAMLNPWIRYRELRRQNKFDQPARLN